MSLQNDEIIERVKQIKRNTLIAAIIGFPLGGIIFWNKFPELDNDFKIYILLFSTIVGLISLFIGYKLAIKMERDKLNTDKV